VCRPNPVTGRAAIDYELAAPGPASVTVSDAGGRTVAELASGCRPAGRHSVQWDAAALPAGVYYCTLSAGGRTETVPLVKAR